MLDPDSAVVLVADSDSNVLEDASSTLEKAGYTVVTALGRPAVMDLCNHHPQPIQLAIVDVTLLDHGPEMVERLIKSYPGIRILFTSSNEELEAVPGIGPPGKVRGFLRKPFRRSQLLGRVMKVLDAPLVQTA